MPSQFQLAHTVRAGHGTARQHGEAEGTTMIAEPSNGVHHARTNRLPSPSSNGSNGACHEGAPPSTNGGNGACQKGAPPSTNGDNGGGHGGAPPSTNGANGHDSRGRFVKGNGGGPGNPFGRLMAQLRSAFCKMVTEEDIQTVARELLERAKAGDVAAARLLLNYAIGKPTDAVNPDTLDLEEWDIFRRGPVAIADLRGIVEGIPVDVVGPLVRTVKPYLNAGAADQVRRVLLPERQPSRKERRAARRQRQAARAGPERVLRTGCENEDRSPGQYNEKKAETR